MEWILRTALPKLFGLRTPFAVKYFSRTSGGLANAKDFRHKPTLCQEAYSKNKKSTVLAMEFFHLSKFYSNGENSCAITVKSEHACV